MTHHPVSSFAGLIGFGVLMTAAAIAFIFAISLRFKQVTQAKRRDDRFSDAPGRIKNFLIYVMGQRRLPSHGYRYSGILHIFIFGAFVVLSVDTINFIVDAHLKALDLILRRPPGEPFHLPFSNGPYQALADTFRFLCMVGLGMALVNRLIIKPKRLPLTRDALYTIAFIFGLMFFEVLQTGFDMAITGADRPEIWFSGIVTAIAGGAEVETLTTGYRIAWWGHLATLLAFSNYVPFSKHSHVFAAPPNWFFNSLEPKGALRRMDELDLVEQRMEQDPDWAPEDLYFGARNLEDLSWKQIFDGLACTECGRCTDNCPASISGKPLRPMHIIVDLKHHAEDRYKAAQHGEVADLLAPENILAGGVIDTDVLWSCTTCRACMEVCPVGNEHIPDIIDMRRYLTMNGEPGYGSSKALKGMQRSKKANPWGLPRRDRGKWAEEMEDVVKDWDDENPSEYLYWVGCAGAYDDQGQRVSKSVSRLMNKAGLDFAILGKREACTGDSARRLGDENLFREMAKNNIATLDEAGVKKIVTHCPHCYNTLKNEYRQFGGQYEVIHHSELLSKLVADGTLKPQGEAAGRVVYHDSCYLGRYNDIYDPQRDIIDALPGVQRVEPTRTRRTGLCCGAGGGQMWMEMDIGERMNYVRADELLATEPKVIAVGCNFCATMIGDGVKARNREEDVEVLDLAELLDRAVS